MVTTLGALAVIQSVEEPADSHHKESLQFAAALHARVQSRSHHESPGGIGPWLPVAAVSVALAIGVLPTRGTVAVQADEVLRQAIRTEELWPMSASRWARIDLRPDVARPELRVVSMSIEREVGADTIGFSDVLVQRGLPDAVRSVLTGYRLDWRRPMSAGPFRRWRAGLRERQDVVTRRPDRIVVQTSTREGPVREAQLVLRRENYHVTRQRWIFDRIGVVEMKEVEAPAVVASARPATAAVTPEVAGKPLDDIELDTRLILGTTEADLAGARVSRIGSGLRVEETFASRWQLRAVEQRLRGMRDVNLRPSPAAPAVIAPLTAFGPGMGRRLEDLGIEADERGRFVPELHRVSVRIRQRVGVLHALATRYGNDAAVYAPATNAKFRRLLALHFSALNSEMVPLNARLAVLAGFSGPQRSLPLATVPSDWVRRVAEGLSQVERLERLMTALLVDEHFDPDDVKDGALMQLAAIWETFNRARRR